MFYSLFAEYRIGLGHKTVFYFQVVGNHGKISKAVHIVIHKYLKVVGAVFGRPLAA